MNTKRLITGFLLSFVFLLFFVYLVSGVQSVFGNLLQNSKPFLGDVSGSVQSISADTPAETTTESTAQTITQPEVSAVAAISVDSNLSDVNKIVFEKASDEKLPIASLTKIMTAIVVLDNYKLSQTTTVDRIADSQDPLKQDVKFGDTMTVENFLDIMLVESSNKSAYALSEIMGEPAFVSLMNKKAKDIGLENTSFADPTGLSSQNISTASDLSKLAEYILKNYPKIGDISRVKDFYVPGFGNITNSDQLLGEIPEIVCSKTGFTTEAKGCLLLVIDNPKNDGYIINVILGADDRFSEMQKLINWSNAICK
jgi:D-alanyl-D-alanine carboxypeptidase (penicillin-binding protein 5/6)